VICLTVSRSGTINALVTVYNTGTLKTASILSAMAEVRGHAQAVGDLAVD
jgi:hypothetical protein